MLSMPRGGDSVSGEELRTKLLSVLLEAWPKAKESNQSLRELYDERGVPPLSKRFDNEARDALDHLYRIASSSNAQTQVANVNSIREHLRRGAVEGKEWLVEEELTVPVPLPRHAREGVIGLPVPALPVPLDDWTVPVVGPRPVRMSNLRQSLHGLVSFRSLPERPRDALYPVENHLKGLSVKLTAPKRSFYRVRKSLRAKGL